jgi:hypothetical protein
VGGARAKFFFQKPIDKCFELWYTLIIKKREGMVMDRKAKSVMHKELIDLLLKDTENDDDFFSRLLYALQVVSNELNRFDEKNA